jgi:CheY-like chemotaxis protein
MGRILVADDHDSLRRGITRALADAGHDVDEAPNGLAAIEKLHEGQFDVILTDLKMGGADGMDVLRTARALQPNAAVILMTAFGSINTAVEAMRIGAFDFVQKPFEIEEMEVKIEKALDVLLEVKDSYGATQRNMRDRIQVSLGAANAERLITQPIQYDTGVTLLPGKYMMKLLVRDAEVGRIGTYQTSFTIPNLNREPTRLPISSVVLCSHRLTVNEALCNVKTTDKQSIGHPLIDAGQKLLPSVTRVFSASRVMHVYLEAYEQYATATQPLVAFATFYRDGVKVFESQPIAVTGGIDRTSKPIPIRFAVPLESLPPGRYECQVTVIEPTGKRAAFWQAPIAVVP